MNTPGCFAEEHPFEVVDRKSLVALSEFSLVPNSECK
jgi:hypothetical protein